jgi:3-oxoacyl-(acyl-carrier-protein) synthase
MSGPLRVVVTGLGVVSPLGVGTESFWRAARDGKVGTGDITLFDTSAYQTHRGGEIKDWPLPGACSVPGQSRSESFAIVAARMALEDAELLSEGRLAASEGYESDRVGVCFGVVLGNRPHVESTIRALRHGQAGPGVASTGSPPMAHDPTRMSRLPASEFGLWGPNLVIPTACAAGNSAIGYAMDIIVEGRADAMIAGGADEMSEAMFMMFNSFHALAPEVVQPFDLNRKGLMLSEGAAALVIESERHARRRGAFIYGQVAGHANYSDAFHMTAPHPQGLGAVRSMEAALVTAGLAPYHVSYISAHGTGTPANDGIEARAIRTVFGGAADSIPVSSIKSMLGHTQGAASAIEAVSCLLAIRDGVMPPTINLKSPDPECDVDIVANVAREAEVAVAMNNAFGFGGNISCVVFASPKTM